MQRITPVSWKRLECVFLKAGFKFRGQTGSHRRYLKTGCPRPVIIPAYDKVGKDIIMANLRTAQMSREEYFRYLEEC
jgi:predicted RNA binding protein YcfA (HicA-like mRNA interferase family)